MVDDAITIPKAIVAYKKAIALEPALRDAHYKLALLYHELGLAYKSSGGAEGEDRRWWQLAIREWKDTLALESEASGWVLLGDAYNFLKEYDEAIKAYRSVISIKPDSKDLASAHLRIGSTYLNDLQQYQNAVSAFREALRLNPNDPAASSQLGAAYFHLGQYPNAVAAFKQAIRLQPDHGLTYYALGHTYISMGQKQDALQVYRTLQTIDKANAEKLLAEINKSK